LPSLWALTIRASMDRCFWLEPVSVRHPATWEFTREHCF